jgi:Ca2+-binding RTX toxin-like protein
MHALRNLNVSLMVVVCAGVGLTQAVTTQLAAADPAGEVIRARSDGFAIIAGDGQTNHLVLQVSGGELLIRDEGIASFANYPSFCHEVPATTGAAVSCPFSGDILVRVRTGDGDDYVEGWDLPASVALRVETGPGSNTVLGGDGDDRIYGGALADETDTLYGGFGNDWVKGFEGDDYLRGNDGDDIIWGGGGLNFAIIGDEGQDVMHGGPGIDYMSGGAGDDFMTGGGSFDSLHGEGGDDSLYGNAGGDDLRGGGGHDRFLGGPDDDYIYARDDAMDQVGCGDGPDTAYVDESLDQVAKNCEKIHAN